MLADLRAVGCDMLTLGQYLAPTLKHIPVARFVPPAEFDALEVLARIDGFREGGERAVRAVELPRRRDGAGRMPTPIVLPELGAGRCVLSVWFAERGRAGVRGRPPGGGAASTARPSTWPAPATGRLVEKLRPPRRPPDPRPNARRGRRSKITTEYTEYTEKKNRRERKGPAGSARWTCYVPVLSVFFPCIPCIPWFTP